MHDAADGTISFAALEVRRKTGVEAFRSGGRSARFELIEFWQWTCSDLTNTALRGVLAEFIVARALGAADGTRVEWDACDVRTADGLKVEVKSAAYLQSWRQAMPSSIPFDVRPSLGWDAATFQYRSVSSWSAVAT